MIETRNTDSDICSQYLWGLGYIDELCLIRWQFDALAVRQTRDYYALQDANYNVLGVVDADGDLVERYDYTPYGERRVYNHHHIVLSDYDDDGDVDLDDFITNQQNYGMTGVTHAEGDSDGDGDVDLDDFILMKQEYGYVAQTGDALLYQSANESLTERGDIELCPFGHQGLFYDKETGLCDNRARYLNPAFGRFTSNDPIGTATAPLLMARNSSTLHSTQHITGNGSAASMSSTQVNVIDDAYSSAMEKSTATFGSKIALSSPNLLQYANGANLYEYVGSAPVSYTDPSGMDRYVVRQIAHAYLVVPIWDKKCCRIVRWKRYDFSARADISSVQNTLLTALNGVASFVAVGGGMVQSQAASVPASWEFSLSCTCEEDKALVKDIEDQISGKTPTYYSLVFHNCNRWAYNHAKKHCSSNSSIGSDIQKDVFGVPRPFGYW